MTPQDVDTKVEREKSEHEYFTMLPNLVDDTSLDVYAFRLYVHLRRVAGDNGKCWQSTRTLAEHCRMSVGRISEAKQTLLEHGLIVLKHEPGPGGIHHIITIADIWSQNMERYKEKRSPDESKSVQSVNTKECVQDANTMRSPGETKKNPVKKNPTLQATPVAESDEPTPPSTFQGWTALLTESKNKPAVIVSMHKTLYPDRPPPDYGLAGATARKVGGYPVLAMHLWQLSTRPPVGDMLAYIQGIKKNKDNGRGKRAGTVRLDGTLSAGRKILEEEGEWQP